jgi:hypothetical protein
MAIYKSREFARWARKQGLKDTALCDAVEEMANGLYEADLGGNLLKKRIARPGQGKRGGFEEIGGRVVGNDAAGAKQGAEGE